MTEEMVLQMLDHRNSDLDDRIKVALDLTEDYVLNHGQGVDDAFMDRLKQCFSEEQIVELVIFLGLMEGVHKFNTIFDVDPPDQLTDGKHIVGLPDVPEDMRQFVVGSEAAD